jgi:hypothetical protein
MEFLSEMPADAPDASAEKKFSAEPALEAGIFLVDKPMRRGRCANFVFQSNLTGVFASKLAGITILVSIHSTKRAAYTWQ